MNRPIIVGSLNEAPSLLALDTTTGQTVPAPDGARAIKQGNSTSVDGHTFALYAEGGTLWFQWDTRRWPFMAKDLPVRYSHDFTNKTTTFSVGDQSITYEAWWSDDPQFEPLIPERDEEMDNLGYYYALKREPERLQRLLSRWSGKA
jgi:hypothetical protein